MIGEIVDVIECKLYSDQWIENLFSLHKNKDKIIKSSLFQLFKATNNTFDKVIQLTPVAHPTSIGNFTLESLASHFLNSTE